ncbi:MAG: alpha/beta hydrolase [Saprospiraceae bacterium]|nr:alpha/beta hydrolase [Saprospiraceae bacterium]
MKKKTLFIGFIFALFIAYGFTSCGIRRFTDTRDSTVFEPLERKQITGQLIRYKANKQTMRYLKIGSDTLPTLVFIHGAPSSLKSWANYYTDSLFLSHFRMISIDRPGYGKSDFGEVVTDLEKQAALIRPLFSQIDNGKPVTLIGSSYGGTIVARLLMDYPGIADRAVLLSASLKPGAEKVYGISHLMKTPIIKYIFPKFLRLATYEKFSHKEELEKMICWEDIQIPVLIIQGDADDLIYPENAHYAKEKLINALVDMIILPGRGHALQFSEPATIKQLFWEAAAK